ncbi:MAG TPA: hypothetical protein VIT62_04130 [Lysobacter sp.]
MSDKPGTSPWLLVAAAGVLGVWIWVLAWVILEVLYLVAWARP